jgi:tetratricopeptide (TPR) repeat protein
VKYLILFSILSFNVCYSNTQIDQAQLIVNFIDQEIKLLEELKQKNINNQIRLLELYSERLGHIKSKEDQIFIEKGNLTKIQAYQKTQKEHDRIQKFGFSIIKTAPRNARVGEIYYTLAINARDFNQGNKTEFLLQKAIQTSNDKAIHYNAKSALADHYYNEKKYKKAIPLYQWAIAHAQDEWKTKNMYNLSWCYLKTNQLKLALDTQLQSYELSSIPGHINITAQALNSLPHFFVMADRSKDGLDFFLKNHPNAAEAIVKMAKRASQNGEYANALYLLNQATDHYQIQKQWDSLVEIKNYLLIFYREHKNAEAHYVIANELAQLSRKYKFNPQQKDSIIEEIKGYAGLKQAYLKKNHKKNNRPLVDRIIAYFDILIILDQNQKSSFQYFQAETHLSQNNKISAFDYYQQALTNLPKQDANDEVNNLTHKIFQGLLFIVDNLNKTHPRYNSMMEYTYVEHIKTKPNDIKNTTIFNKLINYYLSLKKFNQVEDYLRLFNQRFPSEISSQQAFARLLLDHYVKTEDTETITTWVNLLKSEYLSFKITEIKKIEVILSRIMMKRGDNLEDTNQEKLAIELYEKIYERPDYPNNLKADAAFKLSTVYLKQLNHDKLNYWLISAYKLFDQEQLKQNKQKIAAIIDQLILKQEIKAALSISKKMLPLTCSNNQWLANHLFEKNLSLASLTNDVDHLYVLAKQTNCPKLTVNNFTQYLKDFSYKQKLSNNSSMQLKLIKLFGINYSFLLDDLAHISLKLAKNYIVKFEFKSALSLINSNNKILKREELDQLAQTIVKFENNLKITQSFDSSFNADLFYNKETLELNPEVFTQEVDKKMTRLNQIKKMHEEIDINTSYEIYILSLQAHNQQYLKLANELTQLNLTIPDSELLNGYNQYRTDVVKKLTNNYKLNHRKTLKMINDNKIISVANHWYVKQNSTINFGPFEPKRLISSIDL